MDASERYCYNPILRWSPNVEEYFVKAHGADHFSRISESLTRPSCYSCVRVNTLKSTSDVVIEKLLAILQERGWQNVSAEEAIAPRDTVGSSSRYRGWQNVFVPSSSYLCLRFSILFRVDDS